MAESFVKVDWPHRKTAIELSTELTLARHKSAEAVLGHVQSGKGHAAEYMPAYKAALEFIAMSLTASVTVKGGAE